MRWSDIENEESHVILGKRRPEIVENDASRKYPSPSEDPTYKARWNEFLPNVSIRENFNRGHLEQLSILCDLYCDLERLSASIERTGYSYESQGQSGIQIKPYPEVAIKMRTLSEIRNYSRMLGLVLQRDMSNTAAEGEDSWS